MRQIYKPHHIRGIIGSRGGRGRVDDYINLNICFGLVPSWFNRGRAKCTQTVFGWRSVGVFLFHDQVYGSDYLSGGLFCDCDARGGRALNGCKRDLGRAGFYFCFAFPFFSAKKS